MAILIYMEKAGILMVGLITLALQSTESVCMLTLPNAAQVEGANGKTAYSIGICNVFLFLTPNLARFLEKIAFVTIKVDVTNAVLFSRPAN